MKRFFDFCVSFFALAALAIPLLVLALVIKSTSKGSVLYWSKRIGKNNVIFKMPKFRTMKAETPVVATHLLASPETFLTSVGKFLRKTSLDELPQLWSILKGDMSFVGPRPALFNQDDLISLRTECGVHNLTPGLTGWAQINGRDDISIQEKVKLDSEYLKRKSFTFDLYILWRTLSSVLMQKGISH